MGDCPAGFLDLQRCRNAGVRIARIECIDDCILDLAVFAINIFSATGFRKRMDAVKDLSAPFVFDIGQWLPE